MAQSLACSKQWFWPLIGLGMRSRACMYITGLFPSSPDQGLQQPRSEYADLKPSFPGPHWSSEGRAFAIPLLWQPPRCVLILLPLQAPGLLLPFGCVSSAEPVTSGPQRPIRWGLFPGSFSILRHWLHESHHSGLTQTATCARDTGSHRRRSPRDGSPPSPESQKRPPRRALDLRITWREKNPRRGCRR